MRQLAQLPSPTGQNFEVRTPQVYHFNPTTNTQIQEYLPDAVDLKTYAMKYYAAPSPESTNSQCVALGRSLGVWLKAFHSWADKPEQAELRAIVGENAAMQKLKNAINYAPRLMQMVDKYPDILGTSRDILQQVCDRASAELQQDDLGVIHGDFWTGK